MACDPAIAAAVTEGRRQIESGEFETMEQLY
jgi:hypothetical protein